MAEPGTTPPPQTRSNSSTPVMMRGGGTVSLCRPVNCRPRTRVALVVAKAPGGLAPTSWTSVFQL
jgi:hypothetical protein